MTISLKMVLRNLEFLVSSKEGILPQELIKLGKFDKERNVLAILPYKFWEFLELVNKLKIPIKNPLEFLDLRLPEESLHFDYELRDYQRDICEEIAKNGFKAVIQLPTGAGKTIIALKIIHDLKLRTLIVVPTIELLSQWEKKVLKGLNISSSLVGIYGGGRKDVKDITIATYQGASKEVFLKKAVLYFGLIIFDEVHHLPSPVFSEIARRLIAPYRIGLTAFLDLDENKMRSLQDLVGPIIKFEEIDHLIQRGYLADYEYKLIKVKMNDAERQKYRKLMRVYVDYIRYDILPEYPWVRKKEDIFKIISKEAVSDPFAKKAIKALKMAKEIALFPKEKLSRLEELLEKHRNDKVIIFTRHIRVASIISYLFGIPLITSLTKKELRAKIFELFEEGKISKIVSAEALDEGVDIPDANVCIIISGRGSKRQLIQRIGRVLRPKEGKKAIIYELVTVRTLDEKLWRKRRSLYY